MPATSTSRIHPTAFVSPDAILGDNVDIGPHCIINGKVTLGDNVRLIAQVHIEGPADVGANTILYPGACIGFPPQDFKFKLGSPTAGVKIGANCLIREHATVHAATKLDVPTTVGDNCFLMVNAHLGHDARCGNNCVLVNGALLAGHVQMGSNVTMGGAAAIHQFCRVGRLAMISGLTAVSLDLPPFCVAAGRNIIHGLNAIGLRRNGVPREDITMLRKAFREAFRERIPMKEMLARVDALGSTSPVVQEFREFLAAKSHRGIMPAALSGAEDADGAE